MKKIGWAFNESQFRIFLQNENQNCNDLRCVRDDNMIGDITGSITVTDPDYRRKGQDMEMDLYFTSMASVIQSVTLKVCYTDASGNKREIELSNDGLQLHGTELRQTITRLLPASIPVYGFMTVRAIVRNAAGIERTFDAPIRVVSDLYTSLKLLPCEYNSSPASDYDFPILVTASHIDEPVTQWVLRITNPDKRTTREVITLTGSPTYSSVIYHFMPNTLKTGTYTFQLEAVCNSKTTRSEEVSMDVLQVNYDPIKGVDLSNVQVASDIASYKWKREMVEGLNFAAGDFIETDMDISRCVYKAVYAVKEGDNWRVLSSGDEGYGLPENINKYYSVGLDNLISFGVSETSWTNYSFHVYYPAVPVGMTTGELLTFDPVWDASDDDHGYEGVNYVTVGHAEPLHIRLDKDGVFWNNNRMEISAFTDTNRGRVQDVLDRLINAKTLYVGSTEGNHRSRAIYRFVRVVYNGDYSTTSGGNSDFHEDPVDGGSL